MSRHSRIFKRIFDKNPRVTCPRSKLCPKEQHFKNTTIKAGYFRCCKFGLHARKFCLDDAQSAGELYRSSSSFSSSGSAMLAAWLSSFSYCAMRAGSTLTSGGARAGASTNCRPASPEIFLANQRKGFSKL